MRFSTEMFKPKSGLTAMILPAVALLAIGANSMLTGPAHAAKEARGGGGDPVVEFDTTRGPIKAVIYQHDAPLTSENFLMLVNKKFYDGLTFHRYVEGFVIQGGDPQGNGQGNYVDPATGHTHYLKLEKSDKLRHDQAGMLAMARTSEPDTASCQFYFTLAPCSQLDNPPGYAVFGKVVEGLDNVMQLRKGDKMIKVFVIKPGK